MEASSEAEEQDLSRRQRLPKLFHSSSVELSPASTRKSARNDLDQPRAAPLHSVHPQTSPTYIDLSRVLFVIGNTVEMGN